MGHISGHKSYYFQRGKNYYFKRRVPAALLELYDHKEFVRASLKTDSEDTARERATILNAELEKSWSNALSGLDNDIEQEFEQAVVAARMSGFVYRDIDTLSKVNIEKLLTRLESLLADPSPQPEQISAILGAEKTPAYPISQALDDFFVFQQPNLINKNENQLRKWKNPRIKAVRNFILVCGDIDALSTTRQHILKLREWWSKRIQEGGLSAASANKDFGFVGQVLGFVRDNKNAPLNVSDMMVKIRFKEEESERQPFPTEFIQNTLLKIDNLNGLHPECQLFIHAMADTGARIPELSCLDAAEGDIRLDCDIPYIHIRPNKHNKGLKTKESDRMIPLVGSALYAFQQLQSGFKVYFNRADAISATINKYLLSNGLRPDPEVHSLYSLRHSFEDRLGSVEPPDKITAALMGHKFHRERYGQGPSLELKKKYLDMIAFDS